MRPAVQTNEEQHESTWDQAPTFFSTPTSAEQRDNGGVMCRQGMHTLNSEASAQASKSRKTSTMHRRLGSPAIKGLKGVLQGIGGMVSF
jgi:hypothetical protein